MAEKTRSEYREVPKLYTPPSDMQDLLKQIELRKSLTLHQRIAAMIGECVRIPKNGWNDHHQFAYVTQADTVAMTSQLCAKYGVTIISQPVPYPAAIQSMINAFRMRMEQAVDKDELEYLGTELRMMISTWRKPQHEEWTEKQEMTTMLFEFTVSNADNESDHFVRYAWGEGLDGGDKGTYKAWSGAEKYFLCKLFQIPAETESDQSGIDKDERRSRQSEPDESSNRNRQATQRDKQSLKPGDANRGHGNEGTQQAKAALPDIQSEPPVIKTLEVQVTVGKGEKKKEVTETWYEISGTAIGNTGVKELSNKQQRVTIGIGSMPSHTDHPKEQHNRFDCYHKSQFEALALVKRGSKVKFRFRPEVAGDKAAAPGTITQYIEEVLEVDGRKFENGEEQKPSEAPSTPLASPPADDLFGDKK